MFLKRLVLKNFKSFYKTTIIDLPHPVTAIVGPNGSGKSNIVDAIRWALGEQSLKNIRAAKSSDLIFTNKEISAGFCEVELIFDNSNKIFPVDYSEVSILRRLDKDEENSYFINRQACRLKDIIELVAAAKIGLRGFSIISQGTVENILRVSSIERRLMLEENLGLKNLELKKEEAKRKLSATSFNLAKVNVQVQEILPHLRFLRRQIKRWEGRQAIQAELKELELQYFSYLYWQILKEQEAAHRVVNNELSLTERLKKELQELELSIEQEEKQLGLLSNNQDNQLDDQIAALTQEILNNQNEKYHILERLQVQERTNSAQISFPELEKILANIKIQLEKLIAENDLKVIHQGIKNIINTIESLSGVKPQRNKAEIDSLKHNLVLIEQEIENKKHHLNNLQEELSQRTKQFRENFQKLEQKRKQKEELIQQLHQEEILNEKYKLHLADLQRRVEEEQLNFGDLENYFNNHQEFISHLAPEGIAEIERKINRLKKDLLEAGVADESIVKEHEEVEARYNFLVTETADLEKASEDLKNLINKLTNEINLTFNQALEEINKSFNIYFRQIFGGGSAKLVIKKESKKIEDVDKLTSNTVDSENQLEMPEAENESGWGVEIKVDIPKTKLKSLEMLSGGEKTLTALALIFAIVDQSNPPLVVLDEIDAALDEENSARFSKIVEGLSEITQFIIVTHNRLSMEAASVIYGVTISNNISKLVSIKLEESHL
ncbi:MAG: AAA family ATPase [Candidatus Pacebacteria bacterium]|nr:AAA family ATPase [Candidatus Paceibacterota bacterium]